MSLPLFYIAQYNDSSSQIILSEEASKHAVQVLRMQVGDQLYLTNGLGSLITATITTAHKKNCIVQVVAKQYTPPPVRKVCIAVSLVKNVSRFEWFLEKATELGVSEIIPLVCERTERQHFRYERMKGILVSAMLQSKQVWLPVLHEPVKFEVYVCRLPPLNQTEKPVPVSDTTGFSDGWVKLIAHCEDGNKQSITQIIKDRALNYAMLIGPEGDFTPSEITLALQNNYIPITLGETRLRTETAGVVAVALLQIV